MLLPRATGLALAGFLAVAPPTVANTDAWAEATSVVTTAQVDDAAPKDSRVEAFLERSGRWAYVVAPLFMVVVAILPIPAEIPAMANGMIFGALVGTAITWLGAILGALISFELARKFGRPLAERFIKPTVLERADRLVESAGWPALITVRLIPTVAFTAVNWGAGFTSIRRFTFAWTTVLGILPGAIVFTGSGTGLATLFRSSPLAAGGLLVVAILVVWWTVARYRRRPMRLWTGEFKTAP